MNLSLKAVVLNKLAKERGGLTWKQYTDNTHNLKAKRIIEQGVELALAAKQAEVLKEIWKEQNKTYCSYGIGNCKNCPPKDNCAYRKLLNLKKRLQAKEVEEKE